MTQFKKPARPYAKRKGDDSSYIGFFGGPFAGAWIRNYPPTQEEYIAFGGRYKLVPNDILDPAFDEDRQVHFQFVGFLEGMGDADE